MKDHSTIRLILMIGIAGGAAIKAAGLVFLLRRHPAVPSPNPSHEPQDG